MLPNFTRLNALFAVLALATTAYAQGVYPIQVSGMLVPPHSLDLSVYSAERSGDLSFTATLNDPTESDLEVYLRLSVEQNGSTIYETDPNAALPTVRLQQFVPRTFTGSDLAPYLAPANLRGAFGEETSALQVPEGFGEVCLEVRGVRRDIALSRKTCSRANFRLNLVPRPALPELNAQVEQRNPQNILFNWTPMHLGSGNSPGPVEYVFELVRMPVGYYNINDAFESALRVYTTTTPVPSVIYGPAEPLLDPGNLYAWRVRALSILHPSSLLFQNEGYSEVVAFFYHDGIPGGGVLSQNLPSPKGCNVYTTAYPEPINTANATDELVLTIGDVLPLGYFDLEITDLQGGGNAGYSGRGLVPYPMLRAKIEVEFSGLRVDETGRVVAAERIDAVSERDVLLRDEQWAASTVAEHVNSTYLNRLQRYTSGYTSTGRMVSGRTEGELTRATLPIFLDREDAEPVAVTNIRFSPTNAYLNLVSWRGPANQRAAFAGSAVQSSPYGLRTGAHLVGLGSGSSSMAVEPITTTIGLLAGGAPGDKMTINCRGFDGLNESAALQIDPRVLVRAENKAPLQLAVKQVSKDELRQYLGEVGDVDAFEAAELPGFTFEPRRARLDLRSDELHSANSTRAIYLPARSAEWRGLAFDDIVVELPEAYDFTGKGRRKRLTKGELYLDENGIGYGRFEETNLIPLSKGRMGTWPYSMDTLALALSADVAPRVHVAGQLRVPIFPEAFNYTGQLLGAEASRVAIEASVPARSREMPMWQARMGLAATSTIAAQLTELNGERTFVPRANFDGTLGLTFTDAELQDALADSARASTVSRIKALLGVSSLALSVEGVKLNDFALDPLARPADRYTLGSVNLDEATVSVGGSSLTWGGVDVVYAPAVGDAPERLGLRLGMLNGDNKVELVIWSRLRNGEFVFESVEPTTLVLKCNCTAALTFPEVGAYGSILDDVINTYYPDGRTGERAGGEAIAAETLASAREIVKERLRVGALGSFPMLDDERVVVPFLDNVALEVEQRNGRYTATSAIPNEALTFAALESPRANQLPIDVSGRMEQLGVKVNNLPPNTRLLVTGIDFGTRAALGDDTARMELTLLYEVYSRRDDKRYLRFVERNVPITANSVSFTGHLLDLTLAAPGAAGAEREMNFLPQVVIGDETRRSVAHMTCSEGFVAFDVQGRYSAPYSSTAGDAATQIVHPNEKLVGTLAEDTAHFHFNVNTAAEGASHSLRSFVAPLHRQTSGARDGGSQWRFAMRGAEAVHFVPGDSASYRAFVDFDDTREVEDFSHPLGKAFQGLVFDQVGFELMGFADKEGEAKVFTVEDAFYSFDRGLTAHYEKKMPLPRTDSAVLGGWYYELSYLGYNFHNNELKPLTALPSDSDDSRTGDVSGIYTEGSMLVPIFEGEIAAAFAKTNEERPVDFKAGWVDFGGHITFNKVGNAYAPKADWIIKPVANKTYQSSFIPALGMRLKPGSSISLAYAGEDSAWDVEADFSGSAGIYWFKGISRELGLPQDVAGRLSGVSFVWDLLQFEGLTLNKAYSTAESTQARENALMPGIKSIDFGTWSVGLQPQAVGTALKKSDAVNARLDALAAKMRGFQRFGLGIAKVALGLDKAEGAGGVQEDRYRLRIGAQVKMMPDSSEEPTPDKATASGKITRTKGAGARTTVAAGTGGTGPKGKSNTQTAAFAATGEVDFVFKPSKDKEGFDFDDIRLGCFLIEGSYGPVELKGGLNMLRDEGESSMWGEGFKAGLDLTIGPVNAKAVGQFGKTEYDANVGSGSGETSTIMARTTEGEAYRYFFVDLEATYEKGIAIPPPSPSSAPVLNLYGAGGGFLFNMDIPPSTNLLAGGETPVATNPRKDNDNCGIAGDLLKPGVNLYGMSYRPNQGAYGGNVSVILGPYSPPGAPPTLIGDVTLRVGLERNTAGTIGLSYIQVDGNAYLTPESASKRRETYGALANVSVKYSHQTKVLEGGLRLEASFPNSENKVASVNLQQKQIAAELKSNKTPAAKKAAIDKIKADAAAAEPLARSKAGVEKAVVSARTVINADTSLTAAQKATKLKALDAKRMRDIATAEKADASSVIMELVNVSANLKVDFKNEMWAFKLGSWGDGVGEEPQSGLPYAAARFPKFGDLSFKFYLQAGHAVDGIPPLTAVLPSWNSEISVKDVGTTMPLGAQAKGIAVGGVLSIDAGGKIGPLSGKVSGLAGFDLMMTQRGQAVTCGDGGRIGMNGWYAEGQAYAMVNAKLDIDYDLYFSSGQINVFNAQAAAILQAKLPNPAWMAGVVKGRYSVLGGAVAGKFNYDFEVGDKCQTFTDNSAAIAGIRVITDVVPARDAEDVNVFAEVQLAASLPIGGVLELPKDDKGEIFDRYRPAVEKVTVVRKDTRQAVSGNLALKDDGSVISYAFEDYLHGHTDYEISYSVVWETEQNGSFVPLVKNGKTIREDSTLTFRTGAFPDVIMAGMLEHQVPGYRQRYWHSGYATPELKFNRADPQLATLFPSTGSLDGKNYPLEYVVIVDKVSDGPPSSYTIPITVHPGEELFERPVRTSRSVALGYNLPTVKTELVPVQVVTFPGLDQLQLDKGAMYKLRLLRRPEPQDFAATQSMQQVIGGENERSVRIAKVDTKGAEAANELSKVLYEYHFAVSQYERLSDKLAAAQIDFLPSDYNRSDFSRPDAKEVNQYQSSDAGFIIRDDYYAFEGEKEGFDAFDMERIRRNAVVRHNERSTADNTLRAKAEHQQFAAYSAKQNGTLQTGLAVALYDVHNRSDRHRLGSTVYGWSIPESRRSLSQEETTRGQLAEGEPSSRAGGDRPTVFNQAQRYDLLLQDYSARVLLNQQRVLYQLAATESLVEDKEDCCSMLCPGFCTKWKEYGSIKSRNKDYHTFWQDMRDYAGSYQWYGYSNQTVKSNFGSSPRPYGKNYGGWTPTYERANHGGLTVSLYDQPSWSSLGESINQNSASADQQVNLLLRPRHGKGKLGRDYPDYKSNANSFGSAILVDMRSDDLCISFNDKKISFKKMKRATIPSHIYVFEDNKPIRYQGDDQLTRVDYDSAGKIQKQYSATPVLDLAWNVYSLDRVSAKRPDVILLYSDGKQSPVQYTDLNDSGAASKQDMSLPEVRDIIAKHFDAQLTPYGNTLQSMPGNLKLNEYMAGGPFVAFNDSDLANTSRTPYVRSGVDVEAAGDAYHLVNNKAGEWQKYGVKFEKSGVYKVLITYVANADSELKFELGSQPLGNPVPLRKGAGISQVEQVVFIDDKMADEETVLTLRHTVGGADIQSVAFEKYELPRWAFDPWFYGRMHKNLGGLTPLQHFLSIGLKQGLESSAVFDVRYYKEQNPSVASGDYKEYFIHYLREGGEKGLVASKTFNLSQYRDNVVNTFATGKTDNLALYNRFVNISPFSIKLPNKTFKLRCEGGVPSTLDKFTDNDKGWTIIEDQNKWGQLQLKEGQSGMRFFGNDLTFQRGRIENNRVVPVTPSNWSIEFIRPGMSDSNQYRVLPLDPGATTALCRDSNGDPTLVWLTEIKPEMQ